MKTNLSRILKKENGDSAPSQERAAKSHKVTVGFDPATTRLKHGARGRANKLDSHVIVSRYDNGQTQGPLLRESELASECQMISR